MHYQPMDALELAPHAIGRYTLEFPRGAMLLGWSQSLQGVGYLKVEKGVTLSEYKNIVQKCIDKYRAIPHEEGGTLFEKVVKYSIPNCQSVLYWESKWFKKGAFVEISDFYLKDNVLFKSSGSIRSDPSEQVEYLQGYERTIKALRLRSPHEIPTEPGCCIDGAILRDGPDRDYHEIVSVNVFWPDRPDVRFHVTVFTNGYNPDPPFLTRLKAAGDLHGAGVLRSGRRELAGNPGEEHLEFVEEKNGTFGHLFHWEAQGRPLRYDYPQLVVTMSTGRGKDGPRNSSLSDADALKLWDTVLESLRWRTTLPPTQPGP